jgi:hypothetical protein
MCEDWSRINKGGGGVEDGEWRMLEMIGEVER